MKNTGPQAITIEGVALQYSRLTVRISGPVRYRMFGAPAAALRTPFSLAPGAAIWIAIPVAYFGCFSSEALEALGPFVIEERYLAFTHWVTLQVPTVWVAAYSGPPGKNCLP